MDEHGGEIEAGVPEGVGAMAGCCQGEVDLGLLVPLLHIGALLVVALEGGASPGYGGQQAQGGRALQGCCLGGQVAGVGTGDLQLRVASLGAVQALVLAVMAGAAGHGGDAGGAENPALVVQAKAVGELAGAGSPAGVLLGSPAVQVDKGGDAALLSALVDGQDVRGTVVGELGETDPAGEDLEHLLLGAEEGEAVMAVALVEARVEGQRPAGTQGSDGNHVAAEESALAVGVPAEAGDGVGIAAGAVAGFPAVVAGLVAAAAGPRGNGGAVADVEDVVQVPEQAPLQGAGQHLGP